MAILLCVMALNRPASASDKNLLHRAIKVRGLDNWSLGMDEPDRWQAYGWLSNHEMLFFRYSEPNDASAFAIWAYDLYTQKYRYLKKLSDRFVATEGNPLSINISPDGKWILWQGNTDGSAICGSAVDGSHPFNVPKPTLSLSEMDTFWLADSDLWISLFSDPPMALLYDPISRHVIKKWPISRGSHLNDDSAPGHTAIVESMVVSEQVLLLPLVSYQHPEAHILGIDLTAGGKVTQTFTIHFPPGTENVPDNVNATISPQGNQVVWELPYT